MKLAARQRELEELKGEIGLGEGAEVSVLIPAEGESRADFQRRVAEVDAANPDGQHIVIDFTHDAEEWAAVVAQRRAEMAALSPRVTDADAQPLEAAGKPLLDAESGAANGEAPTRPLSASERRASPPPVQRRKRRPKPRPEPVTLPFRNEPSHAPTLCLNDLLGEL